MASSRRPVARSRASSRATSAPSSAASACSPPYLKAWIASRSGPANVPAARPRRPRPSRRGSGSQSSRQAGQSHTPGVRQPAQRRGSTRSLSVPTFLDRLVVEFVTGLRARARDRPRRQLDDLVGAACGGREEPRAQALAGLHDAARAVDPHRVDGKAHEPHRDGIRLRDAQPLAFAQRRLRQEAQSTGEEVLGGRAIRREDGRPRAVEDAEAGQTLPQDDMAVSAAGARMTMNSDGKMQPTVGSMMRIGAFAALFSARWRRSVRICSDWIRSTFDIDTPSWSAWMIAEMKDWNSFTSTRSLMARSDS